MSLISINKTHIYNTINTSTKPSIIPPTSTPLSSDELNGVILVMRKTQDATLAQRKALILTFNKKFSVNFNLVLIH
jgi:hypothetical protein